MITISLCMIVKNEEDMLARCLDHIVDLVDEIIIVDTGSTDSTRKIAKEYTDGVYSFEWVDDFAAARNYAFSKAKMQYCMWLDADDVIEESERQKFKELKKSLNSQIDFVMMRYHTAFDENGKPSFWYYRERWIKNNGKHLWNGEVHEVITPNGVTMYSDVAVSHKKLRPGDADRNLQIYEKLLSKGKILEPRQQYYYGRELYYHKRYEDALEVFLCFLEMPDGWVENKIEACMLSAYCDYKLEREDNALYLLLRSMEYDLPRAEICCDIGKHFFDREKYKISAYWYQTAAEIDRNEYSEGFILPDCYDYIPYLQLCVCYDKMGQFQKARDYNEKAGKCKPGSKAYIQNKYYFDKILSNVI